MSQITENDIWSSFVWTLKNVYGRREKDEEIDELVNGPREKWYYGFGESTYAKKNGLNSSVRPIFETTGRH